MATLVSVNVGMPRDVSWHGKTVHTGVWKEPVRGPRMVRRLNVEGDGQGDLAGHGGEQRAVLVYQLDSYRHWRDFFGRDDLEHGAFGENFTVDGLPDDEVCIGDRYRIGEAELEVTQPRVTCFRVGMRLGEPRLPSLLVAHHRPGFYLRVIEEGHVRPGDEIVRTRRGRHAVSVSETDALLYLPGHDRGRLRLAADVPALSPGWRQSFQEMLDAPAPGAPEAAASPTWSGFQRLTVIDVVAESPTVTSFYLAAPEGVTLPRPAPGQYLTLRIPEAGTPAPVRTYSLSGDPDRTPYRISVKREPLGLVSGQLRSLVRPGDRLEVAAPRGGFVLDDSDAPVLLVSAGIGLTPVLAMLHRLAATHSPRETWWIHTTRGPETHALAAEAAALVASLPSARSLVYYTRPADRLPWPEGTCAGRLTAAVIGGLGLPADAQAYVCGPDAFMDDVVVALVAAGVGADRVHTERFGSRSPINPGVVATEVPPPHQPPGPPGTGPEVTFARSGLTARWGAPYGSVLELAEACDVPTQWSCRSGVCHTCLTPVLSGETRYVQPPLEEPPDGEVLICSAEPTGELILDL